MTQVLNKQIYKFGFWSVIIVVVSGVVAVFLPLDVPDGYSADPSQRVDWLVTNRGLFIAGWINQIVAMFSLSAVFLCGAWLVSRHNPLVAIAAAFTVALSVMAFIIPKFIAIWTIPLLAETVNSGSTGAEMADVLLLLLNVSVPFSLYTSFDYLGFWLYSLFAILIAVPLYGKEISTRTAAISLGIFGLVYQASLVALFVGEITATEIEGIFLSSTLFLILHVVAMAVVFRNNLLAGPKP